MLEKHLAARHDDFLSELPISDGAPEACLPDEVVCSQKSFRKGAATFNPSFVELRQRSALALSLRALKFLRRSETVFAMLG